MGLLLPTLSVLVFATAAHGRVFQPVELAQKLLSWNVSEWDIPALVCLAHNASGLETNKKTDMTFGTPGISSSSITFYGIFGIPSLWLSDCGLTAAHVMDEDVSDDIKCIIRTMAERLEVHNRTDYLGSLTHHVVDLGKCFDWWEHLPPFIDNSKPAHCPPTTTAPTTSGHLSHAKSSHSLTPTSSSQVVTTCHCDSDLLIISFSTLQILLLTAVLLMCFLLWKSYQQGKGHSDGVPLI